jgi:hydroxylamine dehydrogenase
MNMKRLYKRKFALAAVCMISVMLLSLPAFSEESKQVSLYDGTSDAYKEMFQEHVGMKEGSGTLKDLFKPQKLHMYWSPDRHYEPTKRLDHSIFVKKGRRDLCIQCHEGINLGAVHDWKESAHYNPRKTPHLAMETEQIEESIGKKITRVECFDCHADTEKNDIRMPTADVCGTCHVKQLKEFTQERDHGRPNHVQSWEANVVVPWYAANVEHGQMAGMVGCDMCHAVAEKCDGCHTRHTFSAKEARQPEACMTCHMGPDHPDAESYKESKHGTIYEMQKDHFNFDKPLAQVEIGKDYRTPTCQLCHMYQGSGKFSHNFVSKGIWRMGTVPPKNIEYKSSLKDYPYGIKIIPDKIDIYSEENIQKRHQWIELCSKCHGPRFAELYLETLDDYMFQAFKLTDRAQKVIDDLIADGAYFPSLAERSVYPLGDRLADLLGPDLLGESVFNAFKTTKGRLPVIGPILGVYSIFYQGEGNPLPIEIAYSKMWYFYKLQGYKGTAHAQQAISWWWGEASMLQEFGFIQSEAARLRREANIEAELRKKTTITESKK